MNVDPLSQSFLIVSSTLPDWHLIILKDSPMKGTMAKDPFNDGSLHSYTSEVKHTSETLSPFLWLILVLHHLFFYLSVEPLTPNFTPSLVRAWEGSKPRISNKSMPEVSDANKNNNNKKAMKSDRNNHNRGEERNVRLCCWTSKHSDGDDHNTCRKGNRIYMCQGYACGTHRRLAYIPQEMFCQPMIYRPMFISPACQHLGMDDQGKQQKMEPPPFQSSGLISKPPLASGGRSNAKKSQFQIQAEDNELYRSAPPTMRKLDQGNSEIRAPKQKDSNKLANMHSEFAPSVMQEPQEVQVDTASLPQSKGLRGRMTTDDQKMFLHGPQNKKQDNLVDLQKSKGLRGPRGTDDQQIPFNDPQNKKQSANGPENKKQDNLAGLQKDLMSEGLRGPLVAEDQQMIFNAPPTKRQDNLVDLQKSKALRGPLVAEDQQMYFKAPPNKKQDNLADLQKSKGHRGPLGDDDQKMYFNDPQNKKQDNLADLQKNKGLRGPLVAEDQQMYFNAPPNKKPNNLADLRREPLIGSENLEALDSSRSRTDGSVTRSGHSRRSEGTTCCSSKFKDGGTIKARVYGYRVEGNLKLKGKRNPKTISLPEDTYMLIP